MNIGKVIAELRLKNELLQKDLAMDLQISQSYLSIIENGHVRPSLMLLYRIAHYFRTPVTLLIYEATGVKVTKRYKTNPQLKQMNKSVEPILEYLIAGKKRSIKIKGLTRFK